MLRDYYADLVLPYVLCRPDRPLDDLRVLLRGRMSVLVGHSGVGKSTLVNRLVPEADRAVGAVSAIGKGRHTSSSAVALRLPGRRGAKGDPGSIIDTPGCAASGWPTSPPTACCTASRTWWRAARGAPNCDHSSVDCALDTWVADGHADARRFASYRRLLATRTVRAGASLATGGGGGRGGGGGGGGGGEGGGGGRGRETPAGGHPGRVSQARRYAPARHDPIDFRHGAPLLR